MILNKAQADFIKREFGKEYPVGVENPMSKEEWLKIKDDTFEIEADAPHPMDERSKIAVSICDMFY